MVSQMWTYSLIDALQRVMYEGPISETGNKKAHRIPIQRIRNALQKVNKLVESESLLDRSGAEQPAAARPTKWS